MGALRRVECISHHDDSVMPVHELCAFFYSRVHLSRLQCAPRKTEKVRTASWIWSRSITFSQALHSTSSSMSIAALNLKHRLSSEISTPSRSARAGDDQCRFTVLANSALPGTKGKLRKHLKDSYQFQHDNGDWFLHIGDTGYRYAVDTEPEWKTYIDQAVRIVRATKVLLLQIITTQ